MNYYETPLTVTSAPTIPSLKLCLSVLAGWMIFSGFMVLSLCVHSGIGIYILASGSRKQLMTEIPLSILFISAGLLSLFSFLDACKKVDKAFVALIRRSRPPESE